MYYKIEVFIKTERIGWKVLYAYIIYRAREEKAYLRCANRKQCTFCLTPTDEEISKYIFENEHPPKPIETHTATVKEEINLLEGGAETHVDLYTSNNSAW